VVDENLKLTDLDGKSLSFKDLRGKVVFIHFWSMQCPFEKVADPKVAALEKGWKDNKDVVVLAINANSSEIGPTPPTDGYAAIREHLKTKGLTIASSPTTATSWRTCSRRGSCACVPEHFMRLVPLTQGNPMTRGRASGAVCESVLSGEL
jgi:thiol-disulfide isomerase/thioredoxin